MVSEVKKTILFKFFARIFFILTFVIIVASMAIYYYLERQNGEYITDMIEQSQKQFADTLSMYPNTSEKVKEAFKKSREYAVQNNVLKIELKDQKQKILINYEMHVLPVHVQSVYDSISIASGESLNYIMLPINDQNFALVYIKKINLAGRHSYTLKMITLLPSETVSIMRKKMREVFYSISLILFLVIVSIFPLIYQQYRELEEDRQKLFQSNFQIIAALGNAIALRDSDTSEHNYRVTYYAIRLGEALHIPHNLFPALLKGSFLHDLGKIGISDSILLKPGKLNDKEYAIMQKHVEYGLDMIETIAWLKYDASPIIASHHERYNGSGYPKGLKGDDIPYIARIFAIVDVFDALTSKRPYKESIGLEDSLNILKKGSNSLFDPVMIDTFLTIAPELYNDVYQIDKEAFKKLLLRTIHPYVDYLQ